MKERMQTLCAEDLEGEMHKLIFSILKVIFSLVSSMFKCKNYLNSAT